MKFISDEEIERKIESEWTKFEYKAGGLYSTTFFEAFRICARWFNYRISRQENEALEFAEWISEGGWIRDPFPRKCFSDDIFRYTNISTIDHQSDDKLEMHTPKELYQLFLKHKATTQAGGV